VPKDGLQGVLAKKIGEQRASFEDQVSQLGGYFSKNATAADKAVTPGKGKRAKAKPKYQKEEAKSEMVRPWRAARMDARRNERHQADEGQLPDKITACNQLTTMSD
jgi:hypothetical protein